MSGQHLLNPLHSEECPSVAAVQAPADPLQVLASRSGFFILLMVTATVLFLSQTNTKRATLQSCEISHTPLRALMGGARKHTHVFVF